MQHLSCYTLLLSNIVPNDYLVRDPPEEPALVVVVPLDERIEEPALEERVDDPALEERTAELLEERIIEFVLEERTEVLFERDTDGAALRDGLVAVEVVRTTVLVEREGVDTDVLVRVAVAVRVAVVAPVRVAVVVAALRVAVVVAALRVAVVAVRLDVAAERTFELPKVRFIEDAWRVDVPAWRVAVGCVATRVREPLTSLD